MTGRLIGSPLALVLPQVLGETFFLGAQPDSAKYYLQRFLETPWITRSSSILDGLSLTWTLETLSELGEQTGDWAAAERYSALLLDYWVDPDPELQPRVEAVKRRLERARQRR